MWIARDTSIAFHKWMMENDTQEKADQWFHFSDQDMYNVFIKQYEHKI